MYETLENASQMFLLLFQRENEQLAAFVISHTQRWIDRRLTWNPAYYRGQNQVSLREISGVIQEKLRLRTR